VAKFGFRNGTIVLIPTITHEKQLSPFVLSVQIILHQAVDSNPLLGVEIRTEPGLCSIFFSGKTPITPTVLNCLITLMLGIYLGLFRVLLRYLNSQIVDESKFCLSVPLGPKSHQFLCTCLHEVSGIFNWFSHIWA